MEKDLIIIRSSFSFCICSKMKWFPLRWHRVDNHGTFIITLKVNLNLNRIIIWINNGALGYDVSASLYTISIHIHFTVYHYKGQTVEYAIWWMFCSFILFIISEVSSVRWFLCVLSKKNWSQRRSHRVMHLFMYICNMRHKKSISFYLNSCYLWFILWPFAAHIQFKINSHSFLTIHSTGILS